MKITQVSGINFKGYKPFKNEVGQKGYVFSYPFDSQKYDCRLEVFNVISDEKGNYSEDGKYKDFKLEPDAKITEIPEDEPFAYRYRLCEKNGSNPQYVTEAGTVIQNSYNLVTPNRTQSPAAGGSMKLCFWDAYKPANIEKDKVKYFCTKLGGTLAGLEQDIESNEFKGYSKIIGTPIFTDDSLTDHAYWNKNCFQTAQSLGSVNNYASIQRRMFAKGINFVNDGAFVNEGLEGIHFKHVMKWGKESPYYNWFRIHDEYLKLGVLPDNEAVNQNISHCIVNSPFFIEKKDDGTYSTKEKNPNYDKTKPTYIQIYDKRLMNESVMNRDVRIKKYDKSAPDNPFAINSSRDSVLPYSFEINPEEYKDNIEKIINKSRTPLDTLKGTKMAAQFGTWALDEHTNAETWDANKDILKLNFTQEEVQDYAIMAGKYWTKKTRDILTLYTAQKLKDLDLKDSPSGICRQIAAKCDGKNLPEALKNKLNTQLIAHTLNITKSNDSFYEQIVEHAMSLPLDSIEFGDDIAGIMASPYLTKRATWETGLANAAEKILKQIETPANPIKDQSGNVTEYGKYVLPHLVPEITRFLIIKSLKPDASVFIDKDGCLAYDYNELKEITLKSLGLTQAINPEQEAKGLIERIKQGVSADNKDINTLHKALKNITQNTNTSSFKLAEMLVERSGAGLDWRIDAAKDIADIASMRDEKTSFDYTFDSVIDFWRQFTKNIHEENPNSYIAAELTDATMDFDNIGKRQITRFRSGNDLAQKFLRETGMTTMVNYDYFFTKIPKLFAPSAEDGHKYRNPQRFIEDVFRQRRYLESAPYESILYSYNVAGNHDISRILHGLVLDMAQFHSEPANGKDPKAHAMAQALKKGFGEKLKLYNAIGQSIDDLEAGKYLGKTFKPEMFGVRPIDITIKYVLEQAQKVHGLKLSENEMKGLEDETFKAMLDPALDKLEGIMKILVALPGNPTLYAGDDLGSTGYETKTKNVYLQNRNPVHHEWATEKPFIAKHKKEIDRIMALRSRPELRALNDGAPFLLEGNSPVSAILRQSPDGAMAISLFNLNMHPVSIEKINLGLRGGLTPGTEFVNADNPNDKYVVGKDYSIKHLDGKKIEVPDLTLILYKG